MQQKEKSYSQFSQHGDKFVADTASVNPTAKLPPGFYKVKINQQGTLWFEVFQSNSDKILDLPSPEYDQIVTEMEKFLTPEKRKLFEKMGYIYKRSAFLHGLPGTGKTMLVNRIADLTVRRGGVVLFVDDIRLLKLGFKALDDIQPDLLKLVILEEFDELAQKYETELLTLLDGQVQTNNVIYLATTNYVHKVPKRLYRPGRFSSVIEMQFPTPKARKYYLEHKLGKDPIVPTLLEKTNGMSIDELKEIIQSVVLLENDLEKTCKRIWETRELGGKVGPSDTPAFWSDDDEGEDDSAVGF